MKGLSRHGYIVRLLALVLITAITVFSFASCDLLLNLDALNDLANNDSGDDTVAACLHTFEGEGSIVADGDGYVIVNVCTTCGEEVKGEVSVVSFSEKYLYNENTHWNNVVCEDEESSDVAKAFMLLSSGMDVSGNKTVITTFKGNYGEHDYDENGKCKECHYNTLPSEDLEFTETEDGEGYIVTGRGECKDEHINVPDKHNDKPVVGIGDGAFNNVKDESEDPEAPIENVEIIGITIPDTVISISCTAFSDCAELNNFIVDVANEVFKSENNCLIDSTIGALVRGCEFSVIPDDGSVTIIGSHAFAGCETLVSVTIPDSIEEIGDKAFFECDALVEVKMPENVNMGVDVFRGSIHVEIKVEHNLIYVAATDATCEQPGNIEHFICTDCDHLYADRDGEERIYNVEIPAAHDFVDGICTKCGQMLDYVKIVAVDEIPYLGKFPLGTLEDAIGLPAEVGVSTADGVRHQLKVNWELSDYNKAVVGEYTIRGHLVAGDLHFADGVSGEVEAKIEIVEFMQGTADIVFVLDTTGSMGDEISNVKANIQAFAKALEEQGVSARWAVVNYLDFADSNEPTYTVMNGASEWFVTASEFEVAVGNIALGWGGDGPEVAIDGVMHATTLTTRKDARTFYILVTDADYKVDNNYGVTSMDELADILVEKGINTSVIAPTSYQYLYEVLADQTGGIVSNIYGSFGDDLLDALVPIIQNKVVD